ncbi:MAG: hypothetical protein ACR2IE_17595 [Candidatus Sumerlaeaceae bacterium]
MKLSFKLFLTAAVAVALFATPSAVQAHGYDTDDDGHPLRYFAYPIHAMGVGLEYAVTRPLHYVASQCKVRRIVGHVSHPKTDNYWGDWDQYQRYSY